MPRHRLTVFVSAFFLLLLPGINHKAFADEVTITITGPDAPFDGDQYSAAGGTAPYTWSITKGSIDANGVVIVSGQCGTATITATDDCGQTGTKDVMMASGKYVLIPYQTGVTGPCASIVTGGCYDAGSGCTGAGQNPVDIYEGVYYWDIANMCCLSGGSACCLHWLPGSYTHPGCGGNPNLTEVRSTVRKFIWQCQ